MVTTKPIRMEKYIPLRKLENGSYGEIYKGRNTRTVENVLMRKYIYPDNKEGIPNLLIKQVSLLRGLQHQNLLSFLDVEKGKEENTVYLVYEYKGLSLKLFLESDVSKEFGARLRKIYLRQIIRGVHYLHRHSITHMDLNPQNVFVILESNIVKVGGNHLLAYGRENMNPAYKAPELLLGLDASEYPADMWSIGCIFAEMVLKQTLFPGSGTVLLTQIFSITGTPNEDTLPGVSKSNSPSLRVTKCDPRDLAVVVPNLEPDGIDLLSKLLCLDPGKRITAKDAVNHRYFRELCIHK